MVIIMRATLCALVGSIHPSDEVEGLPLLLLDTKDISTSFHSRHDVAKEDQAPTGKTIKMRSLASLLTLQEQDLYVVHGVLCTCASRAFCALCACGLYALCAPVCRGDRRCPRFCVCSLEGTFLCSGCSM